MSYPNKSRGISLIIVIMVMAFLFSIGLLLLSITGTGPRIAGNVRFYQEAFNAAEAGFDSSWVLLNENFATGEWLSFAGHYLEAPNIDVPDKDNLYYFRRLTDEELLNYLDNDKNGQPDYTNILFFNHPYVPQGSERSGLQYTFTCFLINDEVGGLVEDHQDALLVCIGIVKAQNKILATSRLEINVAYQGS